MLNMFRAELRKLFVWEPRQAVPNWSCVAPEMVKSFPQRETTQA
mgnify:CR=1|tara:strand:+ start:612 stop:743 length:132 start_codon:yes stop_codon:yes gene_type:complete